MRNAGIIHYALFWNGNNGVQCAYFVNNGLQSASKNRRFLRLDTKYTFFTSELFTSGVWISYLKWYMFYNNNLSVVLGSKLGGMLKLVNPKHEDWASMQLLTVSVFSFLFILSRCPGIFQSKQINITYIEGVIDNNNKQNKQKTKNSLYWFYCIRLYWVIFQFFMQKYCT